MSFWHIYVLMCAYVLKSSCFVNDLVSTSLDICFHFYFEASLGQVSYKTSSQSAYIATIRPSGKNRACQVSLFVECRHITLGSLYDRVNCLLI